MQEETDALLVQLALAEDKQALTQLLERYQALALLLAVRSTRNREVAYEIVQEALLQAYLSLHRLHDPARFKSWLYGIVLNLCRSWVRDQASEPALENLSQAHEAFLVEDPYQMVEERELCQMVRAALDVLSPNNRAVAVLFYYEDCSIQSIADQLQISPTAVRNRLLKAREQMRVHLKMLYPDIPVTTPRQYRRIHMVSMTLARVQPGQRTTLVLVDQSHQQVLLLVNSQAPSSVAQRRMRMLTAQQQKAVASEPQPTHFVLDTLQALGGTLVGVEIDMLPTTDILYTKIKLDRSDGLHQNLKAYLEDALPLVVETHCPVEIAQEILERQGIKLAEIAGDFEQQLETLVGRAQMTENPRFAHAITMTKVPHSLDFMNGFSGWSLRSFPEMPKLGEYKLDTAVTYQNTTSLFLTLPEEVQKGERKSGRNIRLMHEGFLANEYRGKRLRMVAYTRSENVEHGEFSLHIRGSARDSDGVERRSTCMTSNNRDPLEGTEDWQRYELVIDVPEDAVLIEVGFTLNDHGTVWLDGFQFEVVDVSVPLTGTFSFNQHPQQPVNLRFTHGFDGWRISGSSPQDYSCDLEQDEQGTPVVFLQSRRESPRGTIALQQTFDAHAYRGQTVRLTAALRAANLQQASFSLSCDSRVERTIQGTTDWQTYEITLLIPDKPGVLELGLMLSGQGQVWLRDLHFFTLAGKPIS